MAISVFTQGRRNELDRFYEFLNINKADTFLENTTISFDPEENTVLKISGGKAEITLQTPNISKAATMTFVGKTITGTVTSPAGYASSYHTCLVGAMLCKNGILLKFSGTTSSNNSTLYTSYPIMITVDNKGVPGIASLSGETVQAGSPAAWNVLAYDSSYYSGPTCKPYYNAAFTSLAPIVPICDDNMITFPYAYAPIFSQLSGEGLQAVTIDGTNYITNGRWYIIDE